jgi:hypothetical protein
MSTTSSSNSLHPNPTQLLPSLHTKANASLTTDFNTLITTISNDSHLLDEITTLNSSAEQTQRQLNLLQDHVDQTLNCLDTLELSTLPILVSRCQDLEKIYCSIDQLYALVKEIEYGFDRLENRCAEIEKSQGSSASVRKNVGLFFKSIFDADIKQTKAPMPDGGDMIGAVPDFGLYINRSYVSEGEMKRILEKELGESEKNDKNDKDDKNVIGIIPPETALPAPKKSFFSTGIFGSGSVKVVSENKGQKIDEKIDEKTPTIEEPKQPTQQSDPLDEFAGEEIEEEDVEYEEIEEDVEYVDGEEIED